MMTTTRESRRKLAKQFAKQCSLILCFWGLERVDKPEVGSIHSDKVVLFKKNTDKPLWHQKKVPLRRRRKRVSTPISEVLETPTEKSRVSTILRSGRVEKARDRRKRTHSSGATTVRRARRQDKRDEYRALIGLKKAGFVEARGNESIVNVVSGEVQVAQKGDLLLPEGSGMGASITSTISAAVSFATSSTSYGGRKGEKRWYFKCGHCFFRWDTTCLDPKETCRRHRTVHCKSAEKHTYGADSKQDFWSKAFHLHGESLPGGLIWDCVFYSEKSE